MKGKRFATEEAGRTRSKREPKASAPAGLAERNPSLCRSRSLSALILARMSSLDTSSRRPRNASRLFAERSR